MYIKDIKHGMKPLPHQSPEKSKTKPKLSLDILTRTAKFQKTEYYKFCPDMNPLELPYITGDIILCNHFPHEKIRNHLTHKIERKKHDMKQFILYM